MAVLHKRREDARETHITHLNGQVEACDGLIIDAMISTSGTLVKSVDALQGAGDGELILAATDGLLLGPR